MIRRSGDWLFTRVNGELLMMSVAGGIYLGLTEVGARVWEILEKPCEMSEICTTLEAEFDVEPGVCRSEVEAFVADLVQHNAVRIDTV